MSVGILCLALFLSASPSCLLSLLVALVFMFSRIGAVADISFNFVVLVLSYFCDINDIVHDIFIVKQGSLEDRLDSFFGFFANFAFYYKLYIWTSFLQPQQRQRLLE